MADDALDRFDSPEPDDEPSDAEVGLDAVALDALFEEVYRARRLCATPQSLRDVAAYRVRTRLSLARARQRTLDV